MTQVGGYFSLISRIGLYTLTQLKLGHTYKNLNNNPNKPKNQTVASERKGDDTIKKLVLQRRGH